MYSRNRVRSKRQITPDLSLSSDSEEAQTEVLHTHASKVTKNGIKSQSRYVSFPSSPKKKSRVLPATCTEGYDGDDSDIPEIFDPRLDSLDFTGTCNDALDD